MVGNSNGYYTIFDLVSACTYEKKDIIFDLGPAFMFLKISTILVQLYRTEPEKCKTYSPRRRYRLDCTVDFLYVEFD